MKYVKYGLIIVAIIGVILVCWTTLAQNETMNRNKMHEGNKEIITLTLYRASDNEEHSKIIRDIFDEFEKEVDGRIKINDFIMSPETMINKVELSVSSGDVPNMVNLSGHNVPLDNNELVVDLLPYIKKDKELEQWLGNQVTNSEKLNYIAVEKNVIGYWYNKEIFQEVGIEPAKTWEEFWNNCEILKQNNIVPMSLATQETAWLANILLGAIIGSDGEAGTEFMNSYQPTKYDQPMIVEALSNVQKCFQDYAQEGAAGSDYMTAAEQFLSCKTAMIFNGAWMAFDFYDTNKIKDNFADKIGAALYPNETVYMSYSPGYAVFNKGKEEIEASVMFLKYMLSPKVQERIASELQAVPVNSLVQLERKDSQSKSLLYDIMNLSGQAKNQLMDYQATWYPEVYNRLMDLYPQLIYHKISAQQLAEELSEVAENAQKR